MERAGIMVRMRRAARIRRIVTLTIATVSLYPIRRTFGSSRRTNASGIVVLDGRMALPVDRHSPSIRDMAHRDRRIVVRRLAVYNSPTIITSGDKLAAGLSPMIISLVCVWHDDD